MKKTLKIIGNILGWIFNIICILALVLAVFTAYNSYKTGEPANVFGYRPVYVLTGSMEPYMETDSVIITKEVNTINEIKVGDVVTYHVTDDKKKITITHRIYDIKEDGTIITKGDNNNVADAYNLSIDNIEAKVVLVFNQAAWIVNTWKTPSGKILLISPLVALILLYIGYKFAIKDNEEKK